MAFEDLPDTVPGDEADGACVLDPAYRIDGEVPLGDFFSAIRGLLPQDTTLYLEGGRFEPSLADFIDATSVPERLHIAYGTISPRPHTWHLPATDDVLAAIAAQLGTKRRVPFAYHVHFYDSDGVLLWWHDAGANDIVLSRRFGDANARCLEDRLNS